MYIEKLNLETKEEVSEYLSELQKITAEITKKYMPAYNVCEIYKSSITGKYEHREEIVFSRAEAGLAAQRFMNEGELVTKEHSVYINGVYAPVWEQIVC